MLEIGVSLVQSLPTKLASRPNDGIGRYPEIQLSICCALTASAAAALPLHREPDAIPLWQSHPPVDDGWRWAGIADKPVCGRQAVHRVGCHGRGEVGEGGDAAGAFEG